MMTSQVRVAVLGKLKRIVQVQCSHFMKRVLQFLVSTAVIDCPAPSVAMMII